jgi:hypothetical protein
MQSDLEALISEYEEVIGARVTKLNQMISQLKTVWTAKEEHMSADQDILRIKQQIELAN